MEQKYLKDEYTKHGAGTAKRRTTGEQRRQAKGRVHRAIMSTILKEFECWFRLRARTACAARKELSYVVADCRGRDLAGAKKLPRTIAHSALEGSRNLREGRHGRMTSEIYKSSQLH